MVRPGGGEGGAREGGRLTCMRSLSICSYSWSARQTTSDSRAIRHKSTVMSTYGCRGVCRRGCEGGVGVVYGGCWGGVRGGVRVRVGCVQGVCRVCVGCV